MDEEKKLERARRQMLEKLSAQHQLRTTASAVVSSPPTAPLATEHDVEKDLKERKGKIVTKEEAQFTEHHIGAEPAVVNGPQRRVSDIAEGKTDSSRSHGEAGEGKNGLMKKPFIAKSSGGKEYTHRHGTRGKGFGTGRFRGNDEQGVVEASKELSRGGCRHDSKRTRCLSGQVGGSHKEREYRAPQSTPGGDNALGKSREERIRNGQGQSSRSVTQPSQAGRKVQRGQSSSVPEWRRKSEGAKKETDSLATLSRLNRELDATMGRFRVGGMSARIGLTRLEGGEENQWAFLDESDVSDFAERIPEPAVGFPFELDDFQKRAILQIERQNSVFVAAHTSAGKTVIAEYAIALAAAFGGKVFYTSPIKTLSNQKLRDFRQKFKDVGLVTGDVSINDDAQCVIMTTEILRSMLYRGADAIRNLSFVIFDEVQFLNDEERGVVWEESIIMLPPHVGIIMLSATVPNAIEFASWVGKTKERKVAVVTTSKRPVPLQHSWLHYQAKNTEELCETLLLQQYGTFLSENYRKALKEIHTKQKASSKEEKLKKKKSKRRGRGEHTNPEEKVNDTFSVENDELCDGTRGNDVIGPKTLAVKGVNTNKYQTTKREAASASNRGVKGLNKLQSVWTPLVRLLHAKSRTPSVIFCFSKKKCESAVESLESHDLLPGEGEKAYVHRFFDEAITRLREEDRDLPQVLRVRQNLKRGFAAHHAGLLPLIKEITEILFSKGFVKVLFATETFAMGVNMPARTVVFAAVRKNDGRRFRFLESGEYTQMSGRAGRRGLDDVGHVYLFFPPDERIPDERQLCRVMTGKPISLQSAFRLTYNMILNVLRVDELRVEEMMKQSFSEAGEDFKTQGITTMLTRATETLSKLNISNPESTEPTKVEGEHNNLDSNDPQKALRVYAAKFAKLSEASSKLSARELNPIFRNLIRPGRVVIAEVSPGFLSLCVVYSVVPRRKTQSSSNVRQASVQTIVRRETQVWVASLSGVVSTHVSGCHSSILLLSESQLGQKADGNQSPPRVVTNGGLAVILSQIEASNIVYICDEIDDLSSAREEEQANASRAWHFSRNPAVAKKTLVKNAEYIQRLISEWRRRSSMERCTNKGFLIEVMTPDTQRNPSEDNSESLTKPKRPRRHKLVAEVPRLYEARANICLELIINSDLARAISRAGSRNFASKVSKLVLEETVRGKMADLKAISETGSQPSLLPEYLKRVQVLRKMNYLGEDGLSVQLKGRCACEVATVNSVVLTEVILENVLQHLGPAEIASLLSSLVCRKKNVSGIHDKDSEIYSVSYRAAKRAMRSIVERVGTIQEECGVELDFDIADGGDTYEGAICRWDLAHAVYEWANGEPFFNITDLTEQQEGDIVVCVKRLIELLKDAQAVAKGIGNEELLSTMEEAVRVIRRDVIFNGSLYYDEMGHEFETL